MESQRLFSDEQLAVIRNACAFALEDDATLSYAEEKQLQSVPEQIELLLPQEEQEQCSTMEQTKHWNLHISRCAPDCPRDPPEPLVCSDYERCQHCNYMAHGFQCDHGNGSCVLTDMEEINGRRRILVQSIAEK